MLQHVPKPALYLGLAGLIPFAACAGAIWTSVGWIQLNALHLQIGYAAVILTFLGGVHWGRTLSPDATPSWPRLIWSVIPSLLGWIALSANPKPALILLIACFALAFTVDRHAVRAGFFPQWYLGLRRILTLGAMGALLVTLARVWTLTS